MAWHTVISPPPRGIIIITTIAITIPVHIARGCIVNDTMYALH